MGRTSVIALHYDQVGDGAEILQMLEEVWQRRGEKAAAGGSRERVQDGADRVQPDAGFIFTGCYEDMFDVFNTTEVMKIQ